MSDNQKIEIFQTKNAENTIVCAGKCSQKGMSRCAYKLDDGFIPSEFCPGPGMHTIEKMEQCAEKQAKKSDRIAAEQREGRKAPQEPEPKVKAPENPGGQ